MPVLDGFEVFVTNLGKYNEGELVGEWVKLPTTEEEMKAVFERIGIGAKDEFGQVYEEYFITDYDCSIHGVTQVLGEYESLDALNYFADGHTFYLMEHDTHGDEAACIIVDGRGKLSLSDVYNGFDEHTVDLLHQEVMPVGRLPDETISLDEMKEYGYAWGGMLPLREEAAAEVMKSCTIYRLYGDNTEGIVLDDSGLKAHAAQGGIFGVTKVEWNTVQERENPLKAAEMSLEDDYGMIDGIINNGPKEQDKSSEKSGKSSIMDRLKAAKAEPKQDKVSPQKEKNSERDR